jgi:ABC-type multidrug transport system permease subunit
MLAPVYVPRELITGWVHTASGFDPLTPILTQGRNLLAGQTADIALVIAVIAGLIAVMGFWAMRGLRSAEAAG